MSRRGSDDSIGKERKRRGRHLDDDKDPSLYQDMDEQSLRMASDNEGEYHCRRPWQSKALFSS